MCYTLAATIETEEASEKNRQELTLKLIMFQMMMIFLLAGFVVWMMIVDLLPTSQPVKEKLVELSIFVICPLMYLYYYWSNFTLMGELWDLNKNIPEGKEAKDTSFFLMFFFYFFGFLCVMSFIVYSVLTVILCGALGAGITQWIDDRRKGT